MTTANDLRAAVCEELDRDPGIDPADIVVQVLDHDIVLNGTVPSQEQLSDAAAAARRVDGVESVRNLLDVALPSDDYGNDQGLTAVAQQALYDNIAVPAGVKATARAGTIYLTGWVTDIAQRIAAEDTVNGVAGALSVSNQIEISAET